MAIKPVPEGYHTVSPYLVVQGAGELIEFLKSVFGAIEILRSAMPDGRIHAEVRIGDSLVMMGEPQAGGKQFPAMLHVYVSDVDAVYRRALQAGAKSVREPADQPHGDRMCGVEDGFGNQWWIATRIADAG